MTAPIDTPFQGTVAVAPPPLPNVLDITSTSSTSTVVVPTPGPPGQKGDDGYIGRDGAVGPRGPIGPQRPPDVVEWFFGDGPPPDLIVGAKVGDKYMDNTTGNIYTLNEG